MRRALVLGLDGLEPSIVDRLLGEGRLPNLARLRERGGYARVRTTAPAQTPVAWSSLAVGGNPGQHGIFDFLRRDPAHYRPETSLFEIQNRSSFLPPKAVNRRRGTPFWTLLREAGIETTVVRHPCTFPPERADGRLLAGVGVPDLRGGFGSATIFTSAPDVHGGDGHRVQRIQPGRDGRFRTHLAGPRRTDGHDARLELTIEPAEADGVRLRIEGAERPVELAPARWSGWVAVRFKIGTLQSVHGRVRFILSSVGGPEAVTVYASPVHYTASAPPFPISQPWDYAGELENALGPYHTAGMAEDHGALDGGWIDEHAFLDQCQTVFDERRRMLDYELGRFDEGLLFCVFDTPDRIQHMWWRFLEPDHPANARHGFDPTMAARLDEHYEACDRVVGEALEAAGDDTLVLVVSDHGFTSFQRQFHLNRWLVDQGLLVLAPGADLNGASDGATEGAPFAGVDWDRTRAYALGLAGIFLNVRGRESRGIVAPDEAPQLARALAERLTGLPDPARDRTAVARAHVAGDLYQGPHLADAPDVFVGCAPGYRISSATALGGCPTLLFEDNLRRWSGDHVVDPAAVPGVLLMNRPFDGEGAALTDVASTLMAAFGVPPGPAMEGRSLLREGGAPA